MDVAAFCGRNKQNGIGDFKRRKKGFVFIDRKKVAVVGNIEIGRHLYRLFVPLPIKEKESIRHGIDHLACRHE